MAPRRPRQATSCTQCRRRKIRCDGNVPGCSSCLQRGLAHQCRWGDERDDAASHTRPASLRSKQPFAPPFGDMPLASLFRANKDAWNARMEEFFQVVTPWSIADEVVEHFLRELEPLMNLFNRAMLRAELRELRGNLCAQMHSYRAPGTSGNILGSFDSAIVSDDRYWEDVKHYGLVSVLFALLLISCALAPHDRARKVLRLSESADLRQSLDQLYAAVRFFLDESDYIHQPTLWSLQSAILLQYMHLIDMDPQASTIWNSATVRLAQTMGLHRLGSASMDLRRWKQTESKDSTASKGYAFENMEEYAPQDFARHELGRKLWHKLLLMDWIAGAHVDACFSVPEALNRTSPPCSLDDEEVFRISQHPLQDQVRLDFWVSEHEQPTFVSISTDISRCVRDMSQASLEAFLRTGRTALDEADVQRFDERLRRIVREMPDVFQLVVRPDRQEQVRRLHIVHPHLALQRLFLHDQANFRLLSLHRQVLARPLGDPLYKRASDICIEAVRVILSVFQELLRQQSPAIRLGFSHAHVLHTLMILYTIATKWSEDPKQSLSAEPAVMSELKRALSLLEDAPPLAVMRRYPMISEMLAKVRNFCAEHGDHGSPRHTLDSFLVLPENAPQAPDWDLQNLQDLDQWLTELFPNVFRAST